MNYMNISSCYYDEELNDPHCKYQGVLMMYKSKLSLPQLFIDGKARREVIRPEDLILGGSSAPSQCGSGGAMVFSWTYVAAPGPETMWPALDDKTKTTRNFLVKKNTLTVFMSYTLKLKGRMEADPDQMAVEAFVTLDVVPASLKAQIAGGDRAIPTIAPLVIDASGSLDPDNSTVPFVFLWKCVVMPDLLPCTDKLDQLVDMPPVGTHEIKARTFRINSQVILTVTVSKPGTGMLPDSSTVTIDILPAGPPKVLIEPMSKKKQNSNEKIVMKGSIEEDYRNVAFTWSTLEMDEIPFDLPTVDPNDPEAFRDTSTGPYGRNMVIKANMLSPGVEYTFQLSAEDDFGGPGRGSIKVQINTPPSGGTFDVSPTVGVGCQTPFSFSAKNWVDDPDDFPLQFYFAFVKAQLNTGKQEETALCANLNKGSYTAYLPAGDGNNEMLMVKGNVMDKYEGTTSFSTLITVNKPLIPPGVLTLDLVGTVVADALKKGDADTVGQIVDCSSELLNDSLEVDAIESAQDFFMHPDVLRERDEKANWQARETQRVNMNARDALLDSLAAMAAVTTLNKAAIDRQSKSSGRILAGNPAELSQAAQDLAVKQIAELIASTAGEGLGPDTGQAAGTGMGGTMQAVTAAKDATNGTNGTNGTTTRRLHKSRRFLLGVVGSARRSAPALTPAQETEKALAGGIHGSTGDLGGSANAGSTSGEAPAPIMSEAIKVNTKKMFPEDVASKPLGPPPKCHFKCPEDKKCDAAGCEYGPLFYLPANILEYASGDNPELGSQSNGWGANPFGWDPGSAGMGGDVSGFGLGISVSGLPKPILVKMPLKGDDPSSASCAFWDDTHEMWSTQGCVIGKVVPPFVHCYCTHLTDFGAVAKANMPDMAAMNPFPPGGLELSFSLGSLLAIITVFTCYTTYGYGCYRSYIYDEKLRTAAAMVTGKIVMRPDGTYVWETEDDVFDKDEWQKQEDQRLREEKVAEEVARIEAMQNDVFEQNAVISNQADLDADWEDMEEFESSSGDEMDARGHKVSKPKKEKKLSAIDKQKLQLEVLSEEIEATADKDDKLKLQDKYEEDNRSYTMALLEKNIERRVCWVCLHAAPVNRLVAACACEGALEFCHLSCLMQFQRECSGAEWAEMCMMCGEHYEPLVPRWVQLLQVKLLEDQQKPSTQTAEDALVEKERREVLDRELVDMVDNKLYLCWICLVQDNFTNLLTPCKCDGFLKHCHHKCLEQWFAKNEVLGEENTALRKWGTNCNHCGEAYTLKPATGPLFLKLKDKIMGTDASSRGLQVGEQFDGTKLPLFDIWKNTVVAHFQLLHPVMSIVFRAPQDPYTRSMRCTTLLCSVFGGMAAGGIIFGKLLFQAMFCIAAGAPIPEAKFEPPPIRIDRETAYARNLRMAHEARMSKMNPIQVALYQMKNPGAKPPADPEAPPKKEIPVLVYIVYGAATVFHTFCAMLILMYGMTFDPEIANKWLGMSIFTTLNDWLVGKPISFLIAGTILFITLNFINEIIELVERGFDWLKRFLADKCSLDLTWLDVKT